MLIIEKMSFLKNLIEKTDKSIIIIDKSINFFIHRYFFHPTYKLQKKKFSEFRNINELFVGTLIIFKIITCLNIFKQIMNKHLCITLIIGYKKTKKVVLNKKILKRIFNTFGMHS